MPKLLPHYLKFIAFPIGVICTIGLLLTATLASSIQADETVIEWILKDLLLISLIITAFSQERKESPEINKIRFRELMHAVGFGVIMLLYDSLSVFFYSNDLSHMKSGYEILVVILIYYLIFFYIRKSREASQRS